MPKTIWTLHSRVLPNSKLSRLGTLHGFGVFAFRVFGGIPGVAMSDHQFADVFLLNEDGADFSFVAAAVAFEFGGLVF